MLTVEGVVDWAEIWSSQLASSSPSRALAEVVVGFISRKARKSKHTPDTLQHASAIEKHDIFLEHAFLSAEYTFLSGKHDCLSKEYDFSRKELEFLLWRFSITALLLGLRHPSEPNSFPTKTAPQGRRNLSMPSISSLHQKTYTLTCGTVSGARSINVG